MLEKLLICTALLYYYYYIFLFTVDIIFENRAATTQTTEACPRLHLNLHQILHIFPPETLTLIKDIGFLHLKKLLDPLLSFMFVFSKNTHLYF